MGHRREISWPEGECQTDKNDCWESRTGKVRKARTSVRDWHFCQFLWPAPRHNNPAETASFEGCSQKFMAEDAVWRGEVE
jgi:hypothetical protein